jgi:hypothetical protein
MDFESAASDLTSVSDNALSGVANLVRRQLALENEIDNLEELLKERKGELKSVSEDLLPAALEEHGLNELRIFSLPIFALAFTVAQTSTDE